MLVVVRLAMACERKTCAPPGGLRSALHVAGHLDPVHTSGRGSGWAVDAGAEVNGSCGAGTYVFGGAAGLHRTPYLAKSIP